MTGTANIMRSATSAMIASFVHGMLFERLGFGWAGGMVSEVGSHCNIYPELWHPKSS